MVKVVKKKRTGLGGLVGEGNMAIARALRAVAPNKKRRVPRRRPVSRPVPMPRGGLPLNNDSAIVMGPRPNGGRPIMPAGAVAVGQPMMLPKRPQILTRPIAMVKNPAI